MKYVCACVIRQVRVDVLWRWVWVSCQDMELHWSRRSKRSSVPADFISFWKKDKVFFYFCTEVWQAVTWHNWLALNSLLKRDMVWQDKTILYTAYCTKWNNIKMYIGLFIPKKSWTTTLNRGTYKDICSKCLVWQVFAPQAHSLFTLLYNQCTLRKKIFTSILLP